MFLGYEWGDTHCLNKIKSLCLVGQNANVVAISAKKDVLYHHRIEYYLVLSIEKGQSGGCMPLFPKHGSFGWLVFQNLRSFVLDTQAPLALNQLSKSLLSPISMVVTDKQPSLFGVLNSPKIMSFPFFFFNVIRSWNFLFLEWNIYGAPSLLYNHVKHIMELLYLHDPKEVLILSLFFFWCGFQINEGLVIYFFR